MDDDQVADLRQFIAAVISQQTADLREDLTGLKEDLSGVKTDLSAVKKDIARLDQKVDDLSTSVAEAIDVVNDEAERKLKNHEKRITRLEHKAV